MLQFKTNKYYHVYNHGNAGDNVFCNDGNYHYFLQKYSDFISPIADTYAYCLMPNHFHFLIKIKGKVELLEYFKSKNPDLDISNPTSFKTLVGLTSRQFSHLLNGYTQAFNKQQNRKGKLFLLSTNAKPVYNDIYFKSLIHYIHANPVHHGFTKNLEDWPHSSYESFMSEKNTKLKRSEVLEWFGGRSEFYNYHQQPVNEKIKLKMDY